MLPLELRLKLRHEIREVFKMNRTYASFEPRTSNVALDEFIDAWWTNHKTLIEVMSTTPEWDWDHLAIVKHKNLAGEVDFVKAFHLFRGMVYRAHDAAALGTKTDGPSVIHCGVTIAPLRNLMIELFEELILDGLPLSKCKAGSKNNKPFISAAAAGAYKEFLSKEENRPSYKKGDGQYVDRFEEVFGFKFGRYPEALFSELLTTIGETYSLYTNRRNEMKAQLTTLLQDKNNLDLFKLSFLRYLSVDKVSNKTGEGVDKTTIINKMIDYYFKLTAVLTTNNNTYSILADKTSKPQKTIDEFMFGNDNYNGVMSTVWFQLPKDITVKNRDSRGRFVVENRASYTQILNLITQSVHAAFIDETYVLSVHPCDIINGSLGATWGSCHAFADTYPNNGIQYYRYSEGGYHAGNFGYAAGNGLIYYIPQKIYKDIPLWQTPRIQRQWIWVNSDLTAIRQNFFYPGRPNDKESARRAQELRVYLQNLFSTVNGTTGTADWRIGKNVDDVPFRDVAEGGRCLGYNDPVMSRVYVSKDKAPKIKDILISKNTSYFNHPGQVIGSRNTHRAVEDYLEYKYCRITGKLMDRNSGINVMTEEAKAERVVCAVTKELYHPSEMIKVGTSYYSYLGFIQVKNKFRYCEDTKQLEESYVAVTNSLKQTIHYHDASHKDIAQCKVCHAYFTEDVLIDGYCPDHLPSDNISIESIESKFRTGTIALSFEDVEQARNILVALGKVSELKWKSGRALADFVPPTNSVVLFVHKDSVITVNKNRYEGMTLDISTITL